MEDEVLCSGCFRHPSMEDGLPEDVIMFDLLSRLPVKTIIRFNCVCKKWRDLVSHPYFLHLHFSRSREALMIHDVMGSDKCDWRPESLECVEIEQHETDYHLRHIKTLNLNRASVAVCAKIVQLGSVNGLICSYRPYGSVYVFNPVFDDYVILPKLQSDHLQQEKICYGFGVSMIGEYKVVLCSRRGCVEVHTLGTYQWRILGQTPLYLYSVQVGLGVYLNSHVYWVGGYKIYDFDLTTEKFELFPSPRAMEMLGILNGRLCGICWSSVGLEVWEMKETSCWSKKRTIQENICPIIDSLPLCLIDGGLNGTSILMVYDEWTKELVAYCLDTKRVIHSKWRPNFHMIMTYRPSFVKLDNFGLEIVNSVLEMVRKHSTY